MNYQVSRNGQMYGPYTLADLERYVASGNVLLTDMAKSDDMTEWLPVSQILSREGSASATAPLGAAPASFGAAPTADPYGATQGGLPYGAPYGTLNGASDPPNLSWVLVLILSIITCGLFSFVWDIVQSAWMRRVQPSANALFLYIGAIVSEFLNGGLTGAAAVLHHGYTGHRSLLGTVFGLLYFVLLIAARFSMRASLEDYYNRVDPIGLRLGPVMTFFFGNIYFQYHFNRINSIKQAVRYRG